MNALLTRFAAAIIHIGLSISNTAARGRGGQGLSGQRLQIYGLRTQPNHPKPTLSFLLSANPANARFVIGDNAPADSGGAADLEEGETMLYGGGSRIHLKANGDIELYPAGDVRVVGDLHATGDITAQRGGDTISLTGHRHEQQSDSDGDHQQTTQPPS